MPNFALDKDVLKAVFHAKNELDLQKWFKSKKKRNRMRSIMHKFDAAKSIQVMAFRHPKRFFYSISMTFPDYPSRQVHFWDGEVYSRDLTPGGNPFHDYDGRTLIRPPARIKWNAVRRRMRGLARAIVVFCHLIEHVQLRPGGNGYRRVKARFEAMAASS